MYDNNHKLQYELNKLTNQNISYNDILKENKPMNTNKEKIIFENVEDKIKDILYSKDTLFHYTNFESFIKIFQSQELRFSKLNNFSDPSELKKFSFNMWHKGIFKPEDDFILRDGRKISQQEIDNFINKINIICLSSNQQYYNPDENGTEKIREINSIIDELNIICKYYTQFSEINYDIFRPHFGFDKFRMWEQYGQNHQGVCLVFDKNKLKNQEKIKIENVHYVNNFKEYTPNLDKSNEKELYELLNQKQIDYKDENEVRIILESKENDFKYLDIKDSLIGIIIGHNMHTEIEKNLFNVFELIGKNYFENIFILKHVYENTSSNRYKYILANSNYKKYLFEFNTEATTP